MLNILIVTPVFPPAVGGASTYCGLLVKHLLESGNIGRVVVLSEKINGIQDHVTEYSGRLVVLRMFPNRAGRNRQEILQYAKYAYQNLQYLLLPLIARKYGVTVALVHSSFHNYINLMWAAQACLARIGVKCVADVRDWQLPLKRFHQLSRYNRVIACSESVKAHLAQHPTLLEKTLVVPVIQEEISQPDIGEVDATCNECGLMGLKYVVYVGVVKKRKAVNLVVSMFEHLLKSRPDLNLVLVGNLKESSLYLKNILENRQIHYLGPLPREKVLAIVAGSEMVINLSPSEGMPRSSLEAIALGVRVALPPNIPEFYRFCAQSVVTETEPKRVAEQIACLLESGRGCCSYPIKQHYPENVVPMYVGLFEGL